MKLSRQSLSFDENDAPVEQSIFTSIRFNDNIAIDDVVAMHHSMPTDNDSVRHIFFADGMSSISVIQSVEALKYVVTFTVRDARSIVCNR